MMHRQDTGWEFDDGTDSGDYTGFGDGQFFVFGVQKCHERRRQPHTQAATKSSFWDWSMLTRVHCDGVAQVGLYGHVACLSSNLHLDHHIDVTPQKAWELWGINP